MITFAFLGNTLFLTILVSMLSNTFSTIVTNATAEIQFRRAVQTLEGVKSDAIFAYQPPFNILAVFVLLPMKFVVSPRWFHKIHVATVRTINLPVLLFIAIAERRLLWGDSSAPGSAPSKKNWFWEKWKITTHGDLQTVFEIEPPDSMTDDIAVDDELTHHMIRRQFMRQHSALQEVAKRSRRDSDDDGDDSHASRKALKPPKPASRRDSIAPYGESLTEHVRNLIDELGPAGSGGGGGGGVADRLEALEESMGRIEQMLGKLCDADTDDKSLEEEEIKASEMTGTVHDLDRSAEHEQ